MMPAPAMPSNSRNISVFRSMVACGAITSLALMASACTTGGSSAPARTTSPTTRPPTTPHASPLSPSPSPTEAETSDNPFVGRGLYVPQGRAARAAQAAAEGRDKDVLLRLASVPTAVWLTPERHPAGAVGAEVRYVTGEAAKRGELATLVVYGIPDRDCVSHHSAGGLPTDDYLPWVAEIAEAAEEAVVVVLEPDALASAPECGLEEERTQLLGEATRMLSPRVPTYLDAGHSSWLDATTTADLLTRADVAAARGFAVGVAGYGHVGEEQAFADEVADQLGGAHYVIDAGRAGAGPGDDWCNPPGRALGPEPTAVDDGTRLDALLWIKPPGESDGHCGGGPRAGAFWPERALELATAAGW